jgi:hypothetical protein
VNRISEAADSLFEALQRAGALYVTNNTGRTLRVYRTPPQRPATPAAWLGVPGLSFFDPVINQLWQITVVVDGDQPEQADTLYELVAHIWDEVARTKGFNPDGMRPETVPVPGSEGNAQVLGAVINVEYSTAGRTLCPPTLAESTV